VKLLKVFIPMYWAVDLDFTCECGEELHSHDVEGYTICSKCKKEYYNIIITVDKYEVKDV